MGKESGGPAPSVGESGGPAPSLGDLDTRFEILAEFTNGVFFEFDRDGRYLGVWGDVRLMRKSPEELLGRTILEVFGDEGLHFVELVGRVADTGVPESIDYVLDVRAGRRSFHGEARRRTMPNGAPPRVIFLTRDVTEQRELQAKLVQTERLAAIGLLAASVGRELRQPLAFATSSLSTLGEELAAAGAPTANESLGHLRAALRRISEVAESVGIVAAERTRVTSTRDLRRPIAAALDLCASQLAERTRIDVSTPPMPAVRGNEGDLCQIFCSLLLNAAQSMDPWSPSRNHLGVVARDEGDFVRVTVSDTGGGIESEHLSRIFEPFFTTKERGSNTGLGLFVSRRLVEAEGGRITVESTPGVGTSVHVYLPIATSVRSAADGDLESTRLSVLIVDDEVTFLRSLELVLEEMHDVVMCQSGVEALRMVKEDPARFDVILCDLSMPEVDGVTFHAEASKLGLADRFVLMTAGAFTPRTEAFVANVACRRITKPFSPPQLLALIAAVGPRATSKSRNRDAL